MHNGFCVFYSIKQAITKENAKLNIDLADRYILSL